MVIVLLQVCLLLAGIQPALTCNTILAQGTRHFQTTISTSTLIDRVILFVLGGHKSYLYVKFLLVRKYESRY